MIARVRAAIDTADLEALRSLIAAEPELAEADVHFGEGGKNRVPPLHYVCDAAFEGKLDQGQALELADALLAAGVDPERAYAKSGDTFLIAAASLGVESVALRLVERGVDVTGRGLFGATALHWAAHMGLARLVEALIAAGADLDQRDDRYEGTPLHWALHGWTEHRASQRDRVPAAVRALLRGGARLPADICNGLGPGDDELRRALTEPV
ncbi:ankyrin repeat domain-containing protein [Engelhardtia mirabilis]|uniref:Ankyrin repeats (3 copies) n=1 Tax=Engelhardtia mirabilis TaxID=2528011 RepID=A0A518BMY1_9BACT|nr:Ankyrin repeats (3 copies) [Planctomycetes bacterium Pla133]QDV02668.1 Ankyrin repeats (3 copies) [Planctomycetes bacterium Pla86]